MAKFVTFGEIMARLQPPGYGRIRQALPGTLVVTFAGSEANVAASLAYLGDDAAFVTALPDNSLADACIGNLRNLGVDTSKIVRTAQGRLGLFFLETGANQRPSRVIYDRERSAISLADPGCYDWSEIFAGATWFHVSGITPAVSRNAAQATSRGGLKGSILPITKDIKHEIQDVDPGSLAEGRDLGVFESRLRASDVELQPEAG